ncbi:MAG: hypothetical protein DRQ40_05325 [Gammaproteobacteria bacterium]|nr:MAG: hypothetical protein DRQ40_05325 [Gammaproteobacteria bacterium]
MSNNKTMRTLKLKPPGLDKITQDTHDTRRALTNGTLHRTGYSRFVDYCWNLLIKIRVLKQSSEKKIDKAQRSAKKWKRRQKKMYDRCNEEATRAETAETALEEALTEISRLQYRVRAWKGTALAAEELLTGDNRKVDSWQECVFSKWLHEEHGDACGYEYPEGGCTCGRDDAFASASSLIASIEREKAAPVHRDHEIASGVRSVLANHGYDSTTPEATVETIIEVLRSYERPTDVSREYDGKRAGVVMAYINPEALFADGFDAAIIGVGRRCAQPPIVVYSAPRCIEVLLSQGLTLEEAQEHFDFNVSGSWVGPHTPMFVDYDLDSEEDVYWPNPADSKEGEENPDE